MKRSIFNMVAVLVALFLLSGNAYGLALEIVEKDKTELNPSYDHIQQTGSVCPGRDSCRDFKPLEHENDWKKQNCFCDDLCAMYGDCCIDAPSYNMEDQSRNHLNFECVSLKQYGDLYMRQKCADNWPADVVRMKCEGPPDVKDPFGSVPVTSNVTGVTFRTYYCAMCNRDVEKVIFWRPRLECNSLAKYFGGVKDLNGSQVMEKLRYSSERGTWGIDVNLGGTDVFHDCTIDPSIPDAITIRPCTGKQSVSECPEDYKGNATVKRLCESYTAMVFEPSTSYRNVHCAICNNASFDRLICLNLGPFGRFNWRQNFYSHAFSVLFDIGGNQDDQVGFRRCDPGQIYDPFFQKCRSVVCPYENYVYTRGECIDPSLPATTSSTTETTTIQDDEVTTVEINNVDDGDGNSTSAIFRDCPKFSLDKDEFKVVNDTTIYVEVYNKYLTDKEFSLEDDDTVLVCAKPFGSDGTFAKFDATMSHLTLVCLGISIFCLFLHLMASMSIPELRNLNGKNLSSLSLSLIGGYSSFVAVMFVKQSAAGSVGCTTLAAAMYFFFMASFFWMMVIAFDVCRTLRLATKQLRFNSGSQWKKFGVYSLVGWVCPLTLVTVVVVVEHLKDSVPDEYRPGFLENELCWFSSKKALIVYFAVPFAGVMGANAFLFICSASVVYKATIDSSKMTSTCVPKTNFYLYLRLVIIMGLTWIISLVAGFVDVAGLWYTFIVLNSLQGLFIFLSFTCTRKVYSGLKGFPPSSWSFRTTKRSHVGGADQDIPSRYGTRSKTMYTVSKQQASTLSQNSFDGRYL